MNEDKKLNLIYQAKWVIGDNHFNDAGMFRRVYSKKFKTKEDYINKTIIMFNKIVEPDDVVIFLGDLGDRNLLPDILKRMNGRKVLIVGNHDNLTLEKAIDIGFAEAYNTPVFYNKRLVFSHEPVPVEPGVVNAHGHTHMIKLKSDWHLNMCPEWWNYRPVSINHILKKYVYVHPKPSIEFLEEWWKDIQITHVEGENRFDYKEDGTIKGFKSND